MLVCHCHRVNDARVEQVLDAGATGVRGIVRATRAGTSCGGCIPTLRQLCADREAERATVREAMTVCELHADEALAG